VTKTYKTVPTDPTRTKNVTGGGGIFLKAIF